MAPSAPAPLPPPAAPPAAELAAWVRATLGDDFPHATNGLWQGDGARPVRRLGIALQGAPEVMERANRAGVDALLLHRPWGLPRGEGDYPLLVFHEALDERLTTGDNPWLAARLGFTLGAGLGERRGRPLVRLAHAARPTTVGALCEQLRQEFGAQASVWNGQPNEQPIHTLALANAMRPALVACAAHAGATFYLTGQLRRGAWASVWGSDLMAVGLGHAPIEQWGLRWLAGALAHRFGIAPLWLDEGT